MSPETQVAPNPRWMFWTGWILSVLPMPLFALSAYMKLSNAPPAAEGFKDWPANTALVLGVVELACVILYLIPQTAVLGAILVTGYLGGAVATHVRQGESFIIPVVFGVVLWLGLYFRDARIRRIVPLRL